MDVWFTSDWHLGHKLVAGIRGFGSPEEHDEAVAESVRSVVRPGDRLWNLGDLAIRDPFQALEVVRSLPGAHDIVFGNHDAGHPQHRSSSKMQRHYLDVFRSASMAASMRIQIPDGHGRHVAHEVLLSHYPYATYDGQADHPDRDGKPQVRGTQWRLPDEGRWLIHGHTHMADQRQHDRQIHVGWDAWRRPVSLDEVISIISASEA